MASRAIPAEAYAPLLPPATDDDVPVKDNHGLGRRVCVGVLASCAVVALVVAATLLAGARMGPAGGADFDGTGDDAAGGFPWSNEMLQWQRAGFHFQPEQNFMSGTSLLND
jgi:beta-fructofuranosidase